MRSSTRGVELDAVEVASAELIGGADLDNTEFAGSSTRGA
jgi:hypothetical protein